LAPAAIFLAASGQSGKAVILLLWGTVVVGLIDNLLYPILRRKTIASAYRSGVFAIVAASLYSVRRGSFLGPSFLRSLTPFWKSGDAARRRADHPKKLPEARGSSAYAVALECH
jgi:hypothetical protein